MFFTISMVLNQSVIADDKPSKRVFKIKITNLTKGQPITPPVIAVHNANYHIFKLGEASSPGLAALAKDGVTNILEQELAYERNVVRAKTGTGVIAPGASQEVLIAVNHPEFKVSVVAMLGRTNDAIVAVKGLGTKLKRGYFFETLANVYDAGAEANTESCGEIPAPPCNSPNLGMPGEGFIRPHEGILGIGDLDLSRDSFASQAAKISITRVK